MGSVRGRFLPLSRARRMIGDFLHVSQSIPLAHGERRVDLRPLREAVAAVRPRPNWAPIFFKAYAIVAAVRPVLRRVYVPWPWPRLYEHDKNIGSIVVSRPLEGEDGLFYLTISVPERRSLADIDRMIREARELPFAKVKAFRRQLQLARLPWPIRRPIYRAGMNWFGSQRVRFLGTFGMSVLASMGVANLSTWAPWTTMIHYTPFHEDGSVFLRIALDHRVLDGLEVALALREMEHALLGPILDEVRAMTRTKAA